MPYALDTYTGDGLKASFEVTFPYIQRDQVYVFVDKLKLKVVTTGEPVAGEYKWEDSKNVLLGEAPDDGAIIRVLRDTPKGDQIVGWVNGSYIVADDLNTSDKQWLYSIQELLDRIDAIDGDDDGPAIKEVTGEAPVEVDKTDPQKLVISVDETVSTDNPNSLTSDSALMSEKAIDSAFKQHVGVGPAEVDKVGQLRIDNVAVPQVTFWWNGAAWVQLTTEGKKGDTGPVGPPPGLQDPASTVTNSPLKPDGNPGDATVVISQDENSDLQFQFGIPVGKTGATGPEGPQGPQGVGVTYKGAIDATTEPEPVDPLSGDLYINTTTGETTWTGLTEVVDGARLIWNAQTEQWDEFTPVYATDLGYTAAVDKGTITNTNGLNAVIPVVDDKNAGLMTSKMLSDINTSYTLNDVLKQGNTSEENIVIGKDGNNSNIGQGTIETTGSVTVKDKVAEVQISSDPFVGIHGDAAFINITNATKQVQFFQAGSLGARVGNSFNVGGADLSSNEADGFFTQEDGETFIQTQDADADAFRVIRHVDGANQDQFSIDGEGNTTIRGDVTAFGDINLNNAGGHVRFAGTDNGGQPRLVDIQAPTLREGFDKNYTLTLPDSLGTNGQALITDASGNLSWGDAGGGSSAQIDRTGTTTAENKNYRVMLGEDNNNTGASNCYVVTDQSRLYYNPSSNTLTVGTVNGTVANATNATNCSRTITAGNGLTGGGQLNANRTVAVGQGSGISVSATTVGVDSTVERVNSTYLASIGSGAGPSHTFYGKTNAGMYFLDTNIVRFATNGTHRCSMSSGNFTFPGIYSNTSSSGGEVYVNSDGRLRRKGSSRAYKTNIEPIEYSYAENILNNAVPVYYKPNVVPPEFPQAYLDMQQAQRDAGEQDIIPDVHQCMDFCAENNIPWTMDEKWMNEGDNPDHSHWGFIAEDLAEVDPRLCSYNPKTENYDGVKYSDFAPVLLAICQRQRDQIKSLEERLDALEKSAS